MWGQLTVQGDGQDPPGREACSGGSFRMAVQCCYMGGRSSGIEDNIQDRRAKTRGGGKMAAEHRQLLPTVPRYSEHDRIWVLKTSLDL